MKRAALLGACLVLLTSQADAQWRPDGAVSAYVQVEAENNSRGLGGGVLIDVWQPFGAFQLGFSAGAGAITSDNDDANRIFAPVAATVGVGFKPQPVGLRAIARGGFWAGATNEGLRGGGFLAGGVAMDIRMDDTLSLGISFEGWRLWGELRRFLLVPALSLVWRLGGDP